MFYFGKLKMFSNAVGNIFKPREAETTDTKLGIRRHDPDQEGRKKKKSEEDEPTLFSEEDDATVSIEALRVFLDNFLRSLDEAAGEAKTGGGEQQAAHNQNVETTGPQAHGGEAAQAASAYQATAQATSQGSHFDSAPTPGADTALESHEMRTIHTLLADLKALSERGVQNLRIERGESFLQSLSAATEKAKQHYL